MQSQKASCLKCHKRGDTLVCNNFDCPIVVHECCMPSAARFDDTGRFYCPYCLYKQSLVECRQAKAMVKLANSSLAGFLDTRTGNELGHQKYSKCLKRKKSDAPTVIKKRDDGEVECNGIYQPMHVEGGHQDDSHFPKTLLCSQQEAGSTRVQCLGKGSAVNNDENLTKKVKEVEVCRSRRLEEVQTHGCLILEDNTKVLHEKSDSRSDLMLSNDYFMKIQMMEKLANDGQPDEIGNCGITDRDKLQVSLPNCDVLSTREHIVLMTPHSRNLTNEHEETAKTVEIFFSGEILREQTQTESQDSPWCLKNKNSLQTVERYHDKVVEKVQTQEEPKDTFVYCTRDDNAIMVNDKRDWTTDSACLDDHSDTRQVMIDSANGNQCDGVGKYLCQRIDEGRNNLSSPLNPSNPRREDNVLVKYDNPGSSIRRNKEASQPKEQYCSGRVEQELTLEESQEDRVCLTKNISAVLTEVQDEVKDSSFRDEMTKSLENAVQPAEIKNDCYGSAIEIKGLGYPPQDVVYFPTEYNVEMRDELGDSTRKHLENQKIFEGYRDRVARIEIQTKKSYRAGDKKEMVKEFDEEKYTSSLCGMTDEGKTGVNSVNNSPQITRDGSVSVSHVEFGSADESSNAVYLEHCNNSAQNKNLINDIQHGEFSGNSENEAEEQELSTHDKSKHKVESIKRIKWSSILPAARRRKLQWTGEEEEMLKVGVQKYSLTANKNLPWMKILEFGSHIFDGTRTPVDLKDKWKSIKSKRKANFYKN